MKKLTRDEMKKVIGGLIAPVDGGCAGAACSAGCGTGCECPVACTRCATKS